MTSSVVYIEKLPAGYQAKKVTTAFSWTCKSTCGYFGSSHCSSHVFESINSSTFYGLFFCLLVQCTTFCWKETDDDRLKKTPGTELLRISVYQVGSRRPLVEHPGRERERGGVLLLPRNVCCSSARGLRRMPNSLSKYKGVGRDK